MKTFPFPKFPEFTTKKFKNFREANTKFINGRILLNSGDHQFLIMNGGEPTFEYLINDNESHDNESHGRNWNKNLILEDLINYIIVECIFENNPNLAFEWINYKANIFSLDGEINKRKIESKIEYVEEF